MIMNRVLILILVFMFFGCEKKVSALQFEQDVFDEIFLKVVDSTYKDKRLYTLFPKQGKDIYENGKWIGKDTIGQHQRDLDCELKKIALQKDTLHLILAIGNEGLINNGTNLIKYRSNKFTFKHFSELPKVDEYHNWEIKYPKFAGVMFFSRIKFDDKKESGTLSVSYSCGGKCGVGYSVSIRKIKDKWIIDKVEQTWIS